MLIIKILILQNCIHNYNSFKPYILSIYSAFICSNETCVYTHIAFHLHRRILFLPHTFTEDDESFWFQALYRAPAEFTVMG